MFITAYNRSILSLWVIIHALQYVNVEFFTIKIMRHTYKNFLKPKFVANVWDED